MGGGGGAVSHVTHPRPSLQKQRSKSFYHRQRHEKLNCLLRIFHHEVKKMKVEKISLSGGSQSVGQGPIGDR